MSSAGRPKEISRLKLIPPFSEAASYVDTAIYVLPQRMEKDHFRELRESLCNALRSKKRRYVLKRIPTNDGYWLFKLKIHQPTIHTFEIMAAAAINIRARLVEVHIALDLLTVGRDQALGLQDFVEGHFIPNTRSRRIVQRFQGTTYYDRGVRSGIEFALYSDKISKTGRGECCHLEARVRGAVALRKNSLETAESLITLNHYEFWAAKLTLWTPPNWEKLARSSNRATSSRQPEAIGDLQNQRKAHHILRAASQTERAVIVAYELLRLLRKASATYNRVPMRLFSRMKNDYFLPLPGNALWPDD